MTMNSSDNTTPNGIKTEENINTIANSAINSPAPQNGIETPPLAQSAAPQLSTKKAVKYDWPIIIAILGTLTGCMAFLLIALFANGDALTAGGASSIESNAKLLEMFITGDTTAQWAIIGSRICFVLFLIAGFVAFIKSKKQKTSK